MREAIETSDAQALAALYADNAVVEMKAGSHATSSLIADGRDDICPVSSPT